MSITIYFGTAGNLVKPQVICDVCSKPIRRAQAEDARVYFKALENAGARFSSKIITIHSGRLPDYNVPPTGTYGDSFRPASTFLHSLY